MTKIPQFNSIYSVQIRSCS